MAVRTRPGEVVPEAEVALEARLVGLGVWLFLAADTFFFAAWWFAFFYLRALNNNAAWMFPGLNRPSKGFGLLVLALVVLTAGLYWLTRLTVRSVLLQWLASASLAFGIAACLIQGYGMWNLSFGLTQGGYPSVFSGLTGAWLIQLVFAVGWLATVVAQAGPAGDTRLRPYAAGSFGWILFYLAAVGVINYILLYLVA